MIDIAVIPVAGRGINLLPLTKSQPKEMLPVANKPVVQYVVEEMIHCRLERILFITGSDKSAIENHFDINEELIWHLRRTGKEDLLQALAFERAKARYFYTRQRHHSGLGHAVLCAESFVQGNCFVTALGDTILGREQSSDIVRQMIDLFEKNSREVSGVIAFDNVPLQEVVHYGVAKPKAAGRIFEIEDIVEKPDIDNAPGTLIVAARYVFSPEIFDFLHRTEPDAYDTVQLTDAIRLMLQSGKKFLGVQIPSGERRYDIGNLESYYKAFLDFASFRQGLL
ncbi:MAG: UTP--glucose-1-phosphate uridylyltransferase [Planctomycetaceae bacterium]|jgi:UTP--glucose-1-phosphate uridylyltransferase|nr:UTP--glucose-1-phosphate uridylyltransferase [Planctomycetaceae bacterium]